MTTPSRGPRRSSSGTDRPVTDQPATTPGATGRRAAARAGRRERARPYARKSFLERYRGPLLTAAVIAGVAIVGAFTFQAASAKSWECSSVWDPTAGASPAPSPGASDRLGFVQPDMGRDHRVSSPQAYTYCPPASGNHLNRVNQGPIQPRVYSPDDFAEPAGWIHNLEHGGLVVLYRCQEGDPGCTDEAQDQLRDVAEGFPNSPVCNVPAGVIGPVTARFDDMAWPYAALVWGRVLPLETLDEDLIYRFFSQEGERTNPEPQCVPPSPSPAASAGPSGSAAPSPSGSGAASPSDGASGSPSAGASSAPSASPAAS